MIKVVERLEDMSRVGRLKLLRQDDGDIIIVCQPQIEGGLISPGESVEFCASGGRSPNTRKALYELMQAMELDNEQFPAGRVKE